MAIFRITENKDYTVMSNHHLRNKKLSLKAKGLLSVMLSLPDDWDFTLRGLAYISKEGIHTIRVSVNELEEHGYIERHQIRNEKGQLSDVVYDVYNIPVKPKLENPILEKPTSENLISDNPTSEKLTSVNRTQLNTNIQNTKELNTDVIKHPSINQADFVERYNDNVKLVKRNIDYESLSVTRDKAIIDEIVLLIAEVLTVDTPSYKIEGKDYSAEFVKDRMLKVNFEKLEAFLIEFERKTDKIHNMKAYLITSLFNMPSTADATLSNTVKHDLYGN